MEITDRVKEIAEDYAGQRGMEIVDIVFRREQQGMVLRILADKPEGITIDECEEMNNFLSTALDQENIMERSYVLEVSSPGLDRPIKTKRDFERAMGRALEVKTYEKIDGRKDHEGTLMGMDNDNIVIGNNGVSVAIPKEKIAVARLKIEL